MNIVRAFFSPKSGHFFKNFKKGREDLPPTPPSSYAPADSSTGFSGSAEKGKDNLKLQYIPKNPFQNSLCRFNVTAQNFGVQQKQAPRNMFPVSVLK